MQKGNAIMKQVLLACTILSACAQPTAPDPEIAKTEIEQTFLAFAEAVKTGDVEKATSLYADRNDFYWIERGGVEYQDVSAARASLERLRTNDFDICLLYTSPSPRDA